MCRRTLRYVISKTKRTLNVWDFHMMHSYPLTACKSLKIHAPYTQNNHWKRSASPINETVGLLPVVMWTHTQKCLVSVSMTRLACENWGLSNNWLQNDYPVTKLLMWCRAVCFSTANNGRTNKPQCYVVRITKIMMQFVINLPSLSESLVGKSWHGLRLRMEGTISRHGVYLWIY